MLYQVTIRKNDIFSVNRAEAPSGDIVRLFYRKTTTDAEIVSIGEPTETKPGMPYFNIDLPTITNIYKLDNGRILVLFEDGSNCQLYASERPYNIGILKAIENGETKATNEARKQAQETRYTLERDERNAKEEQENIETCKRIAEEVETVAGGDAYKCPHCGEIVTMDELENSAHENEDGETLYTCPNCHDDVEECDFEAVSMWEYLDDVLDVDYVCNCRGEFSAVKFAVALGGPGIYLDTDKRAVCLYWWGASAQWGLSSEAVDALDEVGEEMFNCLK